MLENDVEVNCRTAPRQEEIFGNWGRDRTDDSREWRQPWLTRWEGFAYELSSGQPKLAGGGEWQYSHIGPH